MSFGVSPVNYSDSDKAAMVNKEKLHNKYISRYYTPDKPCKWLYLVEIPLSSYWWKVGQLIQSQSMSQWFTWSKINFINKNYC